jgi:hypothetical protein
MMKELDVLLLWKGMFIAIEAHNYLISYQVFEPQATRLKSCRA